MPRRKLHLLGLAALALAAVLWLAPGERARADDRDLVRTSQAKPYLFILLDTSASMNLSLGDFRSTDPVTAKYVEGFGDDPDSRLYAAKEGLFDVFESVRDVQFGFATFNQDNLRVFHKHWLYYLPEAISGWPISHPEEDTDGLFASDGTRDIEGDLMAFGAFPDPSKVGNSNVTSPDDGVAGSCDDPLDLRSATSKNQSQAIDMFPRLGADGATATYFFLRDPGSGGNNYLLRVTKSSALATPPDDLDCHSYGDVGDQCLPVRYDVWQLSSCNPFTDLLGTPVRTLIEEAIEGTLGDPTTADVWLTSDPDLDQAILLDKGGLPTVIDNPSAGSREEVPGLWSWNNALSSSEVCGQDRPFTGEGWESNYDGSANAPGDPDPTDFDTACVDPSDPEGDLLSPDSCVPPVALGAAGVDLQYNPSDFSPISRTLDVGDVVPIDWRRDNRVEMLQRLAPNYPSGSPNFRVAPFLSDQPGASGLLVPTNPDRPPIMGIGQSPITDALLDVRCWYTGKNENGGSAKCARTPYFDAGWNAAACDNDPEYACRRPYFILISDGGDNCGGNSEVADTSDLPQDDGVNVWALNVGDPQNCISGTLKGLTEAASDRFNRNTCINVSTKEGLTRTLRDILGLIREEARAFASAAVPSVRASANQLIYVANFTPVRSQPRWDGHVNAFVKPVPLIQSGEFAGTPDFSQVCTSPSDDGCFLWDAGDVLVSTQYKSSDPVGDDTDQRRLYYTKRPLGYAGQWALSSNRLFLEEPPGNVNTDEARNYDLWRSLGLIAAGTQDGALSTPEEMDLESETGDILTSVVSPITATLESGPEAGQTVTYLLGDIFHSNPLIVDRPANLIYFATDLEGTGGTCEADGSGDKGYQCFFQRQQFRRKVLYVGANDGFMHAFEAGIFDRDDEFFSNGTGHELFGYSPRGVHPVVRQMANSINQLFSVDGTVAAADMFIDPVHDSATFPDADERQWRTVTVAGLREGGRSYYALDVTQPDPVEEVSAGVFYPKTASDYRPQCRDGGSGCGPVPFPSALWEFSDRVDQSILPAGGLLQRTALVNAGVPPEAFPRMDEDDNTQPDLGDTWSVPVLGRIRLCLDGTLAATDGTESLECNPNVIPNDVEDIYVAVFGGGMDSAFKNNPQIGHYLYMVDIESGKVVYKRKLLAPDDTSSGGSAPMEPAAVDTDRDGYLDRIYIGTTGGYLYRADLGTDAAGKFPTLTQITVDDLRGNPHDVLRVVDDSVGDPTWEPKIIFNANIDAESGSTLAIPRPFYTRPSVFFLGTLGGKFGVAIGTGDREDLWNKTDVEGRFYVFVDPADDASQVDTLIASGTFPKDETDLQEVDVDLADSPVSDVSFLATSGGWYLKLDLNERVITDAFTLFGISFFSSFDPCIGQVDADGNPIEDASGNCVPVESLCGTDSFEKDTQKDCAKRGSSKLFVVGTTNGNPFIPTDSGPVRFRAVSEFVTNPFIEVGQNKNPGESSDTGTSDELSSQDLALMESLKALYPNECKFANYRLDIKTVAADTSIERIASVPICIVERNWKEY